MFSCIQNCYSKCCWINF